MAQLLAVVILDFTEIMYLVGWASIPILFLFLARFYLNGINSSSRKRACSRFLVPTLATVFLLWIFAGFFGGVRLDLKSSRILRPRFLAPSLWFFCPGILHWRGLGIKFGGCNTTASGTILISLTSVKMEPENGLSLSVNRFLTISSNLSSSQSRFSISTFINNSMPS